MNAVLGLLLLAQLNSFEFSAVSSPQTVGDSFQVTVVARDSGGGIYPFNGSALLSTSKDDFWTYVYPSLVTFQNGTWQGNVVITLADTLNLKCTEPQNLVTGESDTFEVITGAPDRLLVILPGEELAPGSPEGRLPNPPSSQIAGQEFDAAVYITDGWHNVVTTREDSVYLAATDSFAGVPPPGKLSLGMGTFPFTFRRAGGHNVIAEPGAGSPLSPDTSTTFTVAPGPFENILLLLPGEEALPGDTAQYGWQTPGKSGEPNDQYLSTPFNVQVYGCDECWNRVTGPDDSVRLVSDFAFSATPPMAPFRDGAVFSAQFDSPGPNQNIWAVLVGSGQESYRNWVSIRPRATLLEVSAPDTVRAGETTLVHVTMRDVNGTPVIAAPCRFSVIAGNGDMLDTALLSDTLGKLTARFLCTRAYGDEHDTIQVRADTTVAVGIFVEMPDASLLEGGIVSFPNPFGVSRDRCEIVYYLRRSTDITVTIHDPFGNEVNTWFFRQGDEGALSGVNRIYWDGRNANGRRVANGIYVLQVVGEIHTGTAYNSTHRIGVVW